MEEKAIEYLDDTIDLTQYIAVIWKRRKFIIALCIISVLVTYVTSKLSPKVYKAQVLLMVTKPIYKISIEPKIQTDTYREASLETWRQLLKSRDIEEEVVSRLKGKGFTNDIDPARLEDMMEIEAIRSTNLLALKIKDSDSKRAAVIANTWAAVFVENNELFNKKETTQTLKVVKVQHETTKKQLTELEEKIKTFDKTTNIELVKQQLSTKISLIVNYEKGISELHMNLNTLLAYLNELSKKLDNEKELFQISGVYTKVEVDEVISTNTEEINPIFLTIKEEVITGESRMASIKQEIKEKKRMLKNLYKEIEILKNTLAEKKLEQKRLNVAYQTVRGTFNILTSKLEELKITEKTISPSVKTVINAYPQKYPIGPKTKKNVIISFAVSIFVAVFLAFLIEFIVKNKNHLVALVGI